VKRIIFGLVIATAATTSILNLNNQQVANAQVDRLRPDLNGLQIRNPGNGMIYWIDEGRRRHILNPSVYTNLFVSKSLDAIDTESITLGTTVNSDNRLVRCGEKNHSLNNRIYFLDQGKKRHIANPKAMDKNNFNWKKVSTIDCPVLSSIPDGETIR
jgi:hypothetical protein